MQSVADIVQHIEKVQKDADTTRLAKPRYFPIMKVGEIVRQGDIYIHRVDDNHEHGAELESRQLAQGFSQGSRHVAEAPSKVFEGTTKPPSSTSQNPFLGPLIKSDVEFTITHPQHAHVTLGAGTYQVTHQMDVRTLMRVRD